MIPNAAHNQWTIEPPHGCRFANQIGGEVTIFFPAGREKEVRAHIVKELNRLIGLTAAPAASALPAAPVAPSAPAAVPINTAAAYPSAISHVTPVIAAVVGLAPAVVGIAPSAPNASTSAPTPAPASPPAGGLTEEEIAAYEAEVGIETQDTLAPPPPASTDCPQTHAMSETHFAQCTLKPGHMGLHAVFYKGLYYPLNLAPQDTWKAVPSIPAIEPQDVAPEPAA